MGDVEVRQKLVGNSDSGLASLFAVASYFKVPGDPATLVRELALHGRACAGHDLVRGAKLLGLKARHVESLGERRIAAFPLPTILDLGHSNFRILGSKTEGKDGEGRFRVIDPVAKTYDDLTPAEILGCGAVAAVLVTRRFRGEGKDPEPFGIGWFLPSIWRYRKPLSHVLVASLFIQLLGLTTPLFFQIVVDKVLAHKSYSTLYVLAAGLLAVGLFDSVMQYLRTYMLSHTTNRIDVELGRMRPWLISREQFLPCSSTSEFSHLVAIQLQRKLSLSLYPEITLM